MSIAVRWLATSFAVVVACSGPSARNTRNPDASAQPDERPMMVNTELPFHYPVALYARKVQGNVTLRLFIDTNGKAVADSTAT